MASKSKTTEASPAVTIKVLSPIINGDGRHEIDAEIEVPLSEAMGLVDAGAAELVTPAPAA